MIARMVSPKNKLDEFYSVLKNEMLKPVYQPIVSLENGSIYGYEALSRITMEGCSFTIEEMFHIAEREKVVWELEEICRVKSLGAAKEKPNGIKLFINVDPNVIYDKKFEKGLTNKCVYEYGLDPEDIIFEVTERSAIENVYTFNQAVEHYKGQGYKIAIDDVGSGHSGLNRICAITSDFIKIDMSIIRNISSNTKKRLLVESFTHFCKNIGIKLIAEGIETEEELETLIKLGVSYGQGFYLAIPKEQLADINFTVKEKIKNSYNLHWKQSFSLTLLGSIDTICKYKNTVSPQTLGSEIFEYVQANAGVTEICVINEDKRVEGFLTRASLAEIFGGRYGYNLNARKCAEEIMSRDFLTVSGVTPIEDVAKMALAREQKHLYDAVVVTQDKTYLGVVTVKELLETAINIQVKRAENANPLTGLPGNECIEEKINNLINEKNHFSVIYLDLDNFKAYNDVYGFTNGDLMIKAVAECMEDCCREGEFLGHVGGDDFVIITKYWEIESLCNKILSEFSKAAKLLYSKVDLENGYILSKNRNGVEDKFNIATLSISAITNRQMQFTNLDEFSKGIASVKKTSKLIIGNSCVII